MFDLNNINGCELISLANIISIVISKNLNSTEIAILSGFFTIIGDSLATLSIFTSEDFDENNTYNC